MGSEWEASRTKEGAPPCAILIASMLTPCTPPTGQPGRGAKIVRADIFAGAYLTT